MAEQKNGGDRRRSTDSDNMAGGERLRILQVIPFFARSMGGPVTATHCLSRELVKRGFEVEILTTDFELDEEFVRLVRGEGIGVTLAKCDLALGQFLVSPSMKSWLKTRARDFDMIHMHEFRSYQNNIVHAFARRHQIPYVLQAHGSLLPFFEKQRLKLLYDFVWGRRILDEAAAVIALNHMEEEECRSMGVKEDKIKIIPNGISISEFELLPERGTLRTKLGICPDWPVVLYLGRIHRIKGLDLLLAAFASLVKELKNVRLILAGPDGGFLTDLESQARVLRIEDRVIVTGPLHNRDKLEAFVDADVFVLPSSYEIFGYVLLESLACGTPVVITDRCGIADVIGNVGGLVVPYDKDLLAGALLSVLSQADLRRRLGQQGRSLVAGRYDWSIVANRMMDVYDTSIRSTIK